LLLFQNTKYKGVPYSTKHGFLASSEEYKLHVLGGGVEILKSEVAKASLYQDLHDIKKKLLLVA
jgi:hypothetical protein